MSRPRRKREKPPARPAAKGKGGIGEWVRWVPLACALIFLLGAFVRFDPRLSIVGDNAQFLILGQSIAEGKGMTQINQPDLTPHTKYPFFFPVLLAAVHKIFPFSFVAPKIFVLLSGVAAIYLLALLLIRVFPLELAIPALLLTAINPEVLQFAHLVLSEIPYMFLSLAALLLYLRWCSGRDWRILAVAFLLAVASYYTRTIGITLVMAFLFSEFFARRFRIGITLLLVFVLLALPWAIRNRTVGEGDSYIKQFLAVYPYEPERGTLSPVEFVTVRMKANVQKYATVEVGKGICSDVLPIGTILPPGFWKTLSILSTLLIVGGLIHSAIRKRGVIEFYTGFYVGICLIWPDVWASLRFLLPILPFLFIYLLHALVSLVRPVLFRRAWIVPVTIAILLSIPALRANSIIAAEPKVYPANWVNYFRAAEWIKANTPEETIVACRKPYLFYLRSHRRSEAYLWSYDPDKVFQQFLDHGVEYVVVSQLSGTERKYLIPTMEKYANRIEVMQRYHSPETFVVRLLREG